jgi:hypothetical protein
MRATLTRRVITAGLRGFYRNRTVSLSSIFILTITLSIITSFFLFRAIFDYTLDQVRQKVDVRIYFNTDATEEQIGDIKAKHGQTQVDTDAMHLKVRSLYDQFLKHRFKMENLLYDLTVYIQMPPMQTPISQSQLPHQQILNLQPYKISHW